MNGFHDTAKAVATVDYTHSRQAWIAVIGFALALLLIARRLWIAMAEAKPEPRL